MTDEIAPFGANAMGNPIRTRECAERQATEGAQINREVVGPCLDGRQHWLERDPSLTDSVRLPACARCGVVPQPVTPPVKCAACEVAPDDLDPRDTPDPASEFKTGPDGQTYCVGCLGVVTPPGQRADGGDR